MIEKVFQPGDRVRRKPDLGTWGGMGPGDEAIVESYVSSDHGGFFSGGDLYFKGLSGAYGGNSYEIIESAPQQAQVTQEQIDRIEKKIDRLLGRFFGEKMNENGEFKRV